MNKAQFRLGLIINPWAGIGGAVGLKGSDGEETVNKALAMGATPKAQERVAQALSVLEPYQSQMQVVTVAGDMGADLAHHMGFEIDVIYTPDEGRRTNADDTEHAAKAMRDAGVDMILFAGGDGTARNICHAVGDDITVLGVPAGCKIHSGVYAVTPKAAGLVVEKLLCGELVTLADADVMDIDEDSFRQGVVRARRYGEMQIPMELRYVQSVKMGGKESDELVLQDIADYVIDEVDDALVVMGSGSTVAFVMEELGLENTLLGVDVVEQRELVASDVTAEQLLSTIQGRKCKLVITLIGGQGHIFGRGNQQLSPAVIRAIGKDNILVIATKAKLQALAGRPLIADTGDAELNRMLSGYLPVITGYKDHVMYAVASPGEGENG